MKIQNILVATDLSETSKKALAYGANLATATGAELHLVYVEDDPILNAETTAQSYRDDARAKATEKLETLLAPEERERLRSRCVVLNGSAAHEIVRYAQEQNIDLIVMGTRGRRALAYMFLGSVAEHVVRAATCPVLTVR